MPDIRYSKCPVRAVNASISGGTNQRYCLKFTYTVTLTNLRINFHATNWIFDEFIDLDGTK